jgi:hypothetical protein
MAAAATAGGAAGRPARGSCSAAPRAGCAPLPRGVARIAARGSRVRRAWRRTTPATERGAQRPRRRRRGSRQATSCQLQRQGRRVSQTTTLSQQHSTAPGQRLQRQPQAAPANGCRGTAQQPAAAQTSTCGCWGRARRRRMPPLPPRRQPRRWSRQAGSCRLRRLPMQTLAWPWASQRPRSAPASQAAGAAGPGQPSPSRHRRRRRRRCRRGATSCLAAARLPLPVPRCSCSGGPAKCASSVRRGLRPRLPTPAASARQRRSRNSRARPRSRLRRRPPLARGAWLPMPRPHTTGCPRLWGSQAWARPPGLSPPTPRGPRSPLCPRGRAAAGPRPQRAAGS